MAYQEGYRLGYTRQPEQGDQGRPNFFIWFNRRWVEWCRETGRDHREPQPEGAQRDFDKWLASR